MSNSIENSFEKLLGRQPTDYERQQLYKVKDALELQNNDALWLVLIALQHYQRMYEDIPARIEQATNVAAQNAAAKAQSMLNETIAQMLPGMQHAVNAAARKAIEYQALGKSMLTMIAGSAIIGLVFALGMFYGSKIFESATKKAITWEYFWNEVVYATGIAAIMPGLIMIGFAKIGDEEKRWWQWLLLAIAFIFIGMLAFRYGRLISGLF